MAGPDMGEAKGLFNRALEVCLLLALPAGVAMLAVAGPLIKTLFQYGNFDAEDARVTANVLMGYAVGVAPYVAGKVLLTSFYARQDTKTPVKIAVICALMNIALALVFIRFMGVAGIALATGIVGWAQFFLLWRGLKGVESATLDARCRRTLPRIAFCSCLMAAVLIMVAQLTSEYHDGTNFEKIGSLLLLVASGLATYSLAVLGTGTIRISEIKGLFVRKKGSLSPP